jgi:hypothetical protein
MLPSNLKVMGVFCASWAEETCFFWLVLGLSPHPVTSWDQHPACDSREHGMLQGILPHIDLLKFDERVLGISLAAEATMIFRQSLTMVIRV